jgi:hypothetical protein
MARGLIGMIFEEATAFSSPTKTQAASGKLQAAKTPRDKRLRYA